MRPLFGTSKSKPARLKGISMRHPKAFCALHMGHPAKHPNPTPKGPPFYIASVVQKLWSSLEKVAAVGGVVDLISKASSLIEPLLR
jgi:hypothetical protein